MKPVCLQGPTGTSRGGGNGISSTCLISFNPVIATVQFGVDLTLETNDGFKFTFCINAT